jgi:hypothetical protein
MIDVDRISTYLEILAGIPCRVSTRFEKRIPGHPRILVHPHTSTSLEIHPWTPGILLPGWWCQQYNSPLFPGKLTHHSIDVGGRKNPGADLVATEQSYSMQNHSLFETTGLFHKNRAYTYSFLLPWQTIPRNNNPPP